MQRFAQTGLFHGSRKDYMVITLNVSSLADVKPSNILVNTQGEIKLCDFGVSGQLIDSMANSFVGCKSYMAPERLSANGYTIKSDFWSLGLSLVELALGRYPVPTPSDETINRLMSDDTTQPASNDLAPTPVARQSSNGSDYQSGGLTIFALLQHIADDPPPTLPAKYFSPEFKDFVDLCLKRAPEERFDIQTILKHPFMERSEKQTDVDVAAWLHSLAADESDSRNSRGDDCGSDSSSHEH